MLKKLIVLILIGAMEITGGGFAKRKAEGIGVPIITGIRTYDPLLVIKEALHVLVLALLSEYLLSSPSRRRKQARLSAKLLSAFHAPKGLGCLFFEFFSFNGIVDAVRKRKQLIECLSCADIILPLFKDAAEYAPENGVFGR